MRIGRILQDPVSEIGVWIKVALHSQACPICYSCWQSPQLGCRLVEVVPTSHSHVNLHPSKTFSTCMVAQGLLERVVRRLTLLLWFLSPNLERLPSSQAHERDVGGAGGAGAPSQKTACERMAVHARGPSSMYDYFGNRFEASLATFRNPVCIQEGLRCVSSGKSTANGDALLAWAFQRVIPACQASPEVPTPPQPASPKAMTAMETCLYVS